MRAGGERRKRGGAVQRAHAVRQREEVEEEEEENACIHLPRNTQACTQHRRTSCSLANDEGRRAREGRKESEKKRERIAECEQRLDGDTRTSRARPRHL